MIDGFMDKFEDFLKEWNDIVRINYGGIFDNHTHFTEATYTKGRKYVKVVQDGSVCAFIDMNNGDIYKPASWKGPAKHVRGNIFSDTDGKEAIGVNDYIFSVRGLR